MKTYAGVPEDQFLAALKEYALQELIEERAQLIIKQAKADRESIEKDRREMSRVPMEGDLTYSELWYHVDSYNRRRAEHDTL